MNSLIRDHPTNQMRVRAGPWPEVHLHGKNERKRFQKSGLMRGVLLYWSDYNKLVRVHVTRVCLKVEKMCFFLGILLALPLYKWGGGGVYIGSLCLSVCPSL